MTGGEGGLGAGEPLAILEASSDQRPTARARGLGAPGDERAFTGVRCELGQLRRHELAHHQGRGGSRVRRRGRRLGPYSVTSTYMAGCLSLSLFSLCSFLGYCVTTPGAPPAAPAWRPPPSKLRAEQLAASFVRADASGEPRFLSLRTRHVVSVGVRSAGLIRVCVLCCTNDTDRDSAG